MRLLDEEGHRTPDQSKKKKKKLAAEIPKGENVDPFNFLGFGMVAYRDLMQVLIVLFAVISLLMIPAMHYYGSYNNGA